MADFEIDFSELDRLTADLGEVPKKAGPKLRQAAEVSARKLRDEWRTQARGLAHAPAFPSSITYDIKTRRAFGVSQVDAEIGPDKDRNQGALGNLIEFGSVNNSPQGLGLGALQATQADFERGLEIALDQAEKEAGL